MNYEYLMKDTEQSVLETLKNHEDRINENTDEIAKLNHKVESQQKLIEDLLRAQNIEPNKFIVRIKIMQYKINKAGQN